MRLTHRKIEKHVQGYDPTTHKGCVNAKMITLIVGLLPQVAYGNSCSCAEDSAACLFDRIMRLTTETN